MAAALTAPDASAAPTTSASPTDGDLGASRLPMPVDVIRDWEADTVGTAPGDSSAYGLSGWLSEEWSLNLISDSSMIQAGTYRATFACVGETPTLDVTLTAIADEQGGPLGSQTLTCDSRVSGIEVTVPDGGLRTQLTIDAGSVVYAAGFAPDP